MSNIYMQNILDHFKNPENYGKIEDTDLVVEQFNPFCGDKLRIYLVVSDGIVRDLKFEGEGCAISQAAMSILSEEIIGKSIKEVNEISVDDVMDMLGIELSPTRLKCATMGIEGVRKLL